MASLTAASICIGRLKIFLKVVEALDAFDKIFEWRDHNETSIREVSLFCKRG